jgi:hypothetical protein
MLKSLRYILTIAGNERRMLYRTTKFRLLAAVGVGFVLLFIIGTTAETLLGASPPSVFLMEGADGYIPLFFFSFVQALLIIFVAGDFRKAEEKARLDQVMLSRPMTTANWVLGKYLGYVSAIMYLNFFLLFLATISRIVKVIGTDVGFNVLPFFTYFIIATVPAILFMTAFVFFLVSLFRSQAVAFIVSATYVISIWAYFQHDFLGLFDYGCFFAPLFPSDFIGFGEIETILKQRLFYTFLAISLLGFSIILYPRLRQSTLSQSLASGIAVAALTAAVVVVYHIVDAHQTGQSAKAAAIAAQRKFAQQPVCKVEHYDMHIDFGDANTPLRVKANMQIFNPNAQALSQLVFALNGALKVSQVQNAGGNPVPFKQEHQMLILDLGKNQLPPGEFDTIKIEYGGTVNAEDFMLDILPDMKGMIDKDNGPLFLDAKPAFLSGDFAFLPAESGWYPTPGAAFGYDDKNPRRKNFATANIEITTPEELTAITQGRRQEPKIFGGQKISRFIAETPVPKLSLNIGKYERLARTFGEADSLTNGLASSNMQKQAIEIELYYRKNHIRNIEVFEDVADTCFQVVERFLEVLGEVTGLPYPYSKLAYVEVPLQFQLFMTSNGFPTTAKQPGVIMIDEIRMADKQFARAIERRKKRTQRRRQDDSPEKIKREVFINAVMSLVSAWQFDTNLFSPIPNYFNFAVDITDPVLDRAVEMQMYESFERRLRGIFYPDRWRVPKSRLEQVRAGEGWWSSWRFNEFYQTEFDSIITRLETTPLSALNPGKDRGLYFGAVDYKASPVLQILVETSGLENYHRSLQRLLEKHRYQPVSRADFLAAMQTQTGQDLSGFFAQWFDEATFPGYRLISARAEKLDTGKMKIAYQVKARVQNGEAGDGFVRVVFHTKGDEISRKVRIGGYEEMEIQIGLEQPPEEVEVVPYFSRNRGRIAKAVEIPNRIRRGSPVDTVFAVSSTVDSLIFYLDDRDEGFFMPVAAEAKYLRPKVKGRTWREDTNALAFGKYFFGLRYKPAGDGDYPAYWETKVPRTGDYDLSFSLPVIKRRWGWTRDVARKFKLFVTTADGVQPLELRYQETADGWVYMGRFRFEKDKPAIIELSDEGQGYILADAIRWEYVR